MRHWLAVLTAASTIALAAPAFAGPAETAFLAKLPGTWTGGGTLSGGETGAVTCTLTLTGSDKISFSGTCNAGTFGPQSYSGALTYDDASGRYVARAGGQTVPGIKSGGGVTFTTKMKTIAGTGDSIMRLSATSIVIDVNLVRTDTGEKIKSHIVLKK